MDLKIRPARADDAERLWYWRNDPDTRANSRSTDAIPWEAHITWLARRLAQAEPHLYIAEHQGVPVSTFRIDQDEVSYTVAPEYRGRGIASAMLVIIAEKFGPKRAEIKTGNEASIRAAQKAGHFVILI